LELTMTDAAAKASSDDVLTAKSAWASAGALWVFYGLACQKIVTDLIIADKLTLRAHWVGALLIAATAVFFLINLVSLAFVQTMALRLSALDGPLRSRARLLHWSLLVGQALISICLLVAMALTLNAAPVGPEHSKEPLKVELVAKAPAGTKA